MGPVDNQHISSSLKDSLKRHRYGQRKVVWKDAGEQLVDKDQVKPRAGVQVFKKTINSNTEHLATLREG